MDSGSSSYHNRCRLCVAESRLSLQLFETEAIRIDLVDKIKSYLSINIAMSDGLPQQICYECLSRIELFHSYKQSCLEAQHTLKHWNFMFCDDVSVPDEIFSGATSSAPRVHNRDLLKTPSQSLYMSRNNSNQPSESSSPELRRSIPFVAQLVPFVKHLEARTNSTPPRNAALLSAEIQQITPQQQKRRLLQNVASIETAADLNSVDKNETASISEVLECNRATRALSEPPPSLNKKVNHIQYTTPNKPSLQTSETIDKTVRSDSSPHSKVKTSRRSRSLTRSPPPHPGLRSRNPGRPSKNKDVDILPSSKQVDGSQPCTLDTRIRTRSKISTRSILQDAEDLTLLSESSTSGIQSKLPEVMVGSLSPSSGNAVTKNEYLLLSPDVTKGKNCVEPTLGKNSSTRISPKSAASEIIAKDFAPSISETVKQRRRTKSLSQSSTKKMKKNACVASADSSYNLLEKNVSDVDTTLSLTDDEANSVVDSNKDGNESDNRSFQSMDESTKALLRILESDDDDDDGENGYNSDFYQSDVPNDDDFIVMSPSGSQNLKSAYVRVEKLSPEIDSKSTFQGEKDFGRLTPKRRPSKDKGQSNQYRLVKVVKDEKTGKERFKCLKCGSLLSHKTYIKEHMKIHTGDKSFVCSICSKAFRNNYLLKSHMGVHKTERNYGCDICGHTFVQRDRLRSHLRIHKMLPYVCKVCGRECTQKQSLIRHMRLHTGERPFKCEYCGNTFSDRTTWINHTRTHTGERPFKCSLCDKWFSRKVSVNAHMRTHSDVRPYCCQLCQSRFKAKNHLVKHLSCVHKGIMDSVVNIINSSVVDDVD